MSKLSEVTVKIDFSDTELGGELRPSRHEFRKLNRRLFRGSGYVSRELGSREPDQSDPARSNPDRRGLVLRGLDPRIAGMRDLGRRKLGKRKLREGEPAHG